MADILIVSVVWMFLFFVYKSGFWHQKYKLAATSCVSGASVLKMAENTVITNESGLVMEDIRMQIVYQLARRSIVKVTVKDAAGSGIIWKIDDEIVIASSRHLLMKDVKAKVLFCNEEQAEADIIGYSQQYDIGFIKVTKENVSDSILRNVFEAVPVCYEIETEADRDQFTAEYSGRQVLQIGANIHYGIEDFSVGNIIDLNFVPLFNTNVLETQGFSRAGMSGGGVFDDGGRMLGMISGGDVSGDSQERVAELTFSLPSMLIAMEYDKITAAG